MNEAIKATLKVTLSADHVVVAEVEDVTFFNDVLLAILNMKPDQADPEESSDE